MNLTQAHEYFGSCPVGMPYGRDEAAPAFEAVSWKESGVQFIGVAGTAGKTAVAQMIAGVLREAGFACGCYTVGALPLQQRIQINGKAVSAKRLGAAAAKLQKLEACPDRTIAELAAACDIFAKEGCTFAVAELTDPMLAEFFAQMPVCAVTQIGDDGSGFTVERLAHTACAMMRKDCTVVTTPAQAKAAVQEMVVCAAKAECELKVPEMEDLELGGGTRMLRTIDYGGYGFLLPHIGAAAAQNAAVAVEVALALWRKGHDIQDEAILEGVPHITGGCGVHFLRQRPKILAAPCHKPMQAGMLAGILTAARVDRVTVVAGLSNCMDPEAFFKALETGFIPEEERDEKTSMAGMSDNPIDRVYLVTPEDEDAVPAEEALEAAKFHFDAEICDTLETAMEKARADQPEVLVVLGGEPICNAAEKLMK